MTTQPQPASKPTPERIVWVSWLPDGARLSWTHEPDETASSVVARYIISASQEGELIERLSTRATKAEADLARAMNSNRLLADRLNMYRDQCEAERDIKRSMVGEMNDVDDQLRRELAYREQLQTQLESAESTIAALTKRAEEAERERHAAVDAMNADKEQARKELAHIDQLEDELGDVHSALSRHENELRLALDPSYPVTAKMSVTGRVLALAEHLRGKLADAEAVAQSQRATLSALLGLTVVGSPLMPWQGLLNRVSEWMHTADWLEKALEKARAEMDDARLVLELLNQEADHGEDWRKRPDAGGNYRPSITWADALEGLKHIIAHRNRSDEALAKMTSSERMAWATHHDEMAKAKASLDAAENRAEEAERELSEWRQVMGEDNTQSVRESNKLRRLIETDLRERLAASEARASRAEGELDRVGEVVGEACDDIAAALVERDVPALAEGLAQLRALLPPTTPGERVGGLTVDEALSVAKRGGIVADKNGGRWIVRHGAPHFFSSAEEWVYSGSDEMAGVAPFRVVKEPLP